MAARPVVQDPQDDALSRARPVVHDPSGDHLGNLLDWHRGVGLDPFVMATKTGRLQASFRLLCPDTEQMQSEERDLYLAGVHEVLCTMEGGQWALDADWWHEEAPPYPASLWHDPVDWAVDELRRAAYEEHPRFAAETVLTLSWRPPSRSRSWLRDLFLTKPAQRQDRAAVHDDVLLFQRGVQKLTDLLRPLLLDVRPLDADETCTYLHRSISWYRYQVRCPWPPEDLDHQLRDTVWRVGQPPKLGDQFLQPLTISSWQDTLGLWLPERLAALPFPCRYHVRWCPMHPKAADTYLKWEEQGWRNKYKTMAGKIQAMRGQAEVDRRSINEEAVAAGESLLDVRGQVQRGEEMLGFLTPTVWLWAPDMETLGERVRRVQAELFAQGLVAFHEETHAAVHWVSCLPGHVSLGIRGRPLRTSELTGLVPHHHTWTGPERDEHLDGPPLLVASTQGTPFNLVTHVGELGHVFIAGPSRSGKSALLGLMIRQLRRYPGMRVCVFDRDYGLQSAVVLGGGTHITLGPGQGTAFQVLADLDSEAERQWRLTWLERVLEDEGLAPTPEERDELWIALGRLARVPRPMRTMSLYRTLLQVQRLKIGLTPYCQGGPYAFFDADHDSFHLDTTLLGFELGPLIDSDAARAITPALSYMFHQLERHWFTGAPVTIIVDEAKWLMGISRFLGEMALYLKARAKKNVALFIATQELVDVAQTDLWQAVLASMPTRLFLPNRQALSEKVRRLYEEMELRETDLYLLARAQRNRDYLYASPLGTRLFQERLDPVTRLLCAASSMPELAVLQQMMPDTPPASLPGRWLRHWGYGAIAADIERMHEVVPWHDPAGTHDGREADAPALVGGDD